MMNKKFLIKSFFDIEKTKSYDISDLKAGSTYDYITRTVMNRGIAKRTGLIDENSLLPSKTFSLELMNMTFFYREKEWYAGQFIRLIKPKFKEITLNWEYFEGVFFGISKLLRTILIRDVDSTFLNSTFEMPVLVDSANNPIIDPLKKYGPEGYIPDWNEINGFIMKIKKEYVPYLEKLKDEKIKKYEHVSQVSGELSTEKFEELLRIEYKQFKIEKLFNVYTGRDVIIRDVKKGNIPLVSHTNENNGITKRIERLNDRILFNHKETISLADRGIFWASAQDEDFHIGTRVKALVLKSGEKSKNVMRFLATSINGLQKFFVEYLENATDKLPQLYISLPVKKDSDNNYIIDETKEYSDDGYIPDWDLMDESINSIYKIVLSEIKSQLNDEFNKLSNLVVSI